MKFLKGLFIGIFILLMLVFIGVYIFLKSFDINKYRAQITAEISKQVGRTVAIDDLGLNLSLVRGVYAQAKGIKMSEDPAYGQGDFLVVDTVSVNVDVLAYLRRREIVVSKVVVAGLNMTVIRDAQGAMNVQKIGPAPAAVVENQAAKTDGAAPAEPLAIPPFTVQAIALENAVVNFMDQAMNPPMRINVSQLEVLVKNFSLTAPFTFEGKAAVIGNEQNVTLQGQAVIDMPKLEAQLSGIAVEFNLAKLAIADLVKAIPQLEPAGLTDKLQGTIVMQIPSLTAGASGLGAMALTGKLQNGVVVTKMLPLPIEKITAAFVADEKDFHVNPFSLQLATGVVTGTAVINDYMKTMQLNTQVKAVAVPLKSLVAQLPDGMTLGGATDATLTVSGNNLANPDLFLSSLNGSGQFNVTDGRIENFNVLKTVLGRIPGLGGALEASLPEQYRKEYSLNQTIFQKLSSSLQITNGVINMPDMNMISNLFEANMQIKADTKLNGKVAGQIKIPADLSQSLASQAAALDYLKDSDGKITISLVSFEGPLTSLKIMPDVKELGKVAIQGEGKRQLGNIINKALGVEGSTAPEGTGDGQKAKPNPGEEIIGGVLNKIFK